MKKLYQAIAVTGLIVISLPVTAWWGGNPWTTHSEGYGDAGAEAHLGVRAHGRGLGRYAQYPYLPYPPMYHGFPLAHRSAVNPQAVTAQDSDQVAVGGVQEPNAAYPQEAISPFRALSERNTQRFQETRQARFDRLRERAEQSSRFRPFPHRAWSQSPQGAYDQEISDLQFPSLTSDISELERFRQERARQLEQFREQFASQRKQFDGYRSEFRTPSDATVYRQELRDQMQQRRAQLMQRVEQQRTQYEEDQAAIRKALDDRRRMHREEI